MTSVLTQAEPKLLALDFDGVLCDGMAEYFETAWRAYCVIWQPDDTTLPMDLKASFARLRPLVETGWEMPLVMRSLVLGIPEAEAIADWGGMVQHLVEKEKLNPGDLGEAVDGTRDRWIASDPESWLALQRFYPGVIDRLAEILQTEITTYIVSTKEGRFIRQLLHQAGIEFPAERVIGKEIKQPKSQTLRDLRDRHLPSSDASVWFVEDRLKTLQKVKQEADLSTVHLFLANWGYNMSRDRQSIREDDRIRLLSLNQFAQPFSHWLP
ncbi:MAG: HAD family hydrolase [Cyanobacteria bacterium J06638_22]